MKKSKGEEINNEVSIEAEKEEIESVTAVEEDKDPMKIALDKANKDAAEYKEMLQRLQAEFDNYRKRNNESVKNARVDGGNEVLLQLLPVADTIEIALKMTKDEKSAEGMKLVLKQIGTLFSKYDVSEIEAVGAEFNPERHNAVMKVEDTENSGKVVEVLQKGYIRQGKVIRYAMVKVAE